MDTIITTRFLRMNNDCDDTDLNRYPSTVGFLMIALPKPKMLFAIMTSQQLSRGQTTILLCLLLSNREALAAIITPSPSNPLSKRQVETVGSDTCGYKSLSTGVGMHCDFIFEAHGTTRLTDS